MAEHNEGDGEGQHTGPWAWDKSPTRQQILEVGAFANQVAEYFGKARGSTGAGETLLFLIKTAEGQGWKRPENIPTLDREYRINRELVEPAILCLKEKMGLAG